MKKLAFILQIGFIFSLTSCKSEYDLAIKDGSAEERLALAMKYLEEEQCFKAQSLFESVIGAYRGKPEQEDIYYHYAESQYCQENYINSAHYFQDFSSTYPNSERRIESDYMIAMSYYMMSPIYRLDQTYTEKAVNEFQLFINMHPTSEKVAECNRLIDECRAKMEQKAFEEGNLYYDLKQYEAATFSFQNLLANFPETPNGERVRYLITKASYKWADNSVAFKQEERYESTVKNAERFLARHSSSPYIKEVKSILEDSNNKLNEISNER